MGREVTMFVQGVLSSMLILVVSGTVFGTSPSFAQQEGERVAIPRAEIQKLLVWRSSWGWVESFHSLDLLTARDERIRVHLHADTSLELTNWTASTDTLYGTVAEVLGERVNADMDMVAVIPALESESIPPTETKLAPPLENEPATTMSPEPEPEPCESKTCFRAQGCPRCRVSFLLDFSMAQTSERCGRGPWFGGEAGLLWNLGSNYGLGGKLFIGGDDCGERYGFRVVGRRWITTQLSLEVGPGIVLGGAEGQTYPSFSLQVALDIAGLIAPVYNLERTQPDMISRGQLAQGKEPPPHWESFFGIRVSSYAAPTVLAALLVLAAATWSDY
jgi:hypothetical protein